MSELVARYTQEYANARIHVIQDLIHKFGNNPKEYPEFPTEVMKSRISEIEKIVSLVDKGYITNFEAVKDITYTAEGEA